MNLKKWTSLKEKTAALSQRERTVLLLASLACVLFIWAQFFYLGFEKQLKQARQEITQQQQLTVDQSDQLSSLMARLASDPNASLREEQQTLRKKLNELKQDIEQRLSNLIEPELMADVMKTVLSDYQGLQLISARNLAVLPLEINTGRSDASRSGAAVNNNNAANTAAEKQAVLFAHTLQLELKGDYFQTLDFLKRLESMKGFYWTMLKYDVKDHPQANITLQVNTLSLEEDWIGV
jgi:MSHA biogenesis protein MshJ